MLRTYSKKKKVITFDDTFIIWGAIFSWAYLLYKGLYKSAGLLLLINLGIAIASALVTQNDALVLIINCVASGFIAPRLMISQLEKENYDEIIREP